MTNAVKVLIQVALLAQSKGLLNLEEAVVVKSSIDELLPLIEKEAEDVQ